MQSSYDYVLVGGGLAGASAIPGIRERDPKGTVLLLSNEKHLPYDRPPLSKNLWLGKARVGDIFIHDLSSYDRNGITVALGATAAKLDAAAKTVTDASGATIQFGKLLLATGGTPRRLTIPGNDLDGICYYRTLDDYQRMRGEAAEGKSALIVGGGFIGSELAAALNLSLEVTMIFPGAYLCSKVFPASLGESVQNNFQQRGVRMLSMDMPVSISKRNGKFRTETASAKSVDSDLLIVGIGLAPAIDLAQAAGLAVENGVVVNEYLETSHADIYAAGDNAFFPYAALGQHTRVEHWDNARAQGLCAGRNMAGAHEPYDYQPYFFSDLFEFGYEAVGEVDATLETYVDWQKENFSGVIYYLRDGKVRGVMLCNVWDKIDAARAMIKRGETLTPEQLRGAIA
jgi:3-phenylpropionate/trans-cinnamate dioxygenase ferredoxin reductase subunit